jgi:hypothetical protein
MENQLKSCPNCKSFYLQCEITGDIIRLGCKRYDCEFCGRKKALKLKKALNKYLSSFKFIRMFTYTVRTTLFKEPSHWNLISSEVWRRYINNIRRNPFLSEKQKAFQYIKVCEFTKKGYIHFHVIQTEYIEWKHCYRAWNEAISILTNRNLVWSDNKIINGDQLGAVNIIGISNHKHASNYVVKYLVKSAIDLRNSSQKLVGLPNERIRLWSKSGRVAFFAKKHTVHAWRFCIMAREDLDALLNLYILDITSQDLAEKIDKTNKLTPV